MKKLMSTIAIIGCLFTGFMSESVAETTVTPENCAHNMEIEYNPANAELYNDIDMFELYMYAVENKCDVCDDMYYEYCECEDITYYGKCECGADYHEIDYMAFVNDYVEHEESKHIKSLSFDDENTDAYLDEFYMDLYMDYYTYTNHCEECDWDYYEYCECDYGQRFDDEYYEERAQNLCDDYLAFVNDYVDYESNCTEYCEGCDKYYYDHCCDEYCDFNVYYMDLQYLEMIQEESTDL